MNIFINFNIGFPDVYKWILRFEHLYKEKPKKAQTSLLSFMNNNHLSFPLPSLTQIQSFNWNENIKELRKNYPEVSSFVKEITKVKYSTEIPEDEVFYLENKITEDEVSILFTTKALIANLFKQEESQHSLIHIDSTYKIIDLRFPVVHISTETQNHNYRPVFFYITDSEKIVKIKNMLQVISNFLKETYEYNFHPRYILSDNADNFITACKQHFKENYTHMTCLFHLKKNISEKTRGNSLKAFEKTIWYGFKSIKNCSGIEMKRIVWNLIKNHWEEKGVPDNFIVNFENEYIKKDIHWYNGCSFPGKSRTNNSLESGKKN